MFFLSLLWRAAATALREFREIKLDVDHLAKLREMLVTNNPEPLDFYPVELVQLSTIGMVHNLTPWASEKLIPAIPGRPSHSIPIFRFYFDGLVVHFHFVRHQRRKCGRAAGRQEEVASCGRNGDCPSLRFAPREIGSYPAADLRQAKVRSWARLDASSSLRNGFVSRGRPASTPSFSA
jgi:hypothetical protein